jgi:hypothetical protein
VAAQHDGVDGGRSTRRQALRAALGAAALTLPFAWAKAPKARAAAGPTDCQKGCRWTAGRDFQARNQNCGVQAAVNELNALVTLFMPIPISLNAAAFKSISAGGGLAQCYDHNLMVNKAALYDCSQPFCPGFDPKKEGGPCDGCRDNCCPCQASENGFICCIFACDDPEHNCCPT